MTYEFETLEFPGIELNTDVLDKITKELEPKASVIVRSTAFRVVQGAQAKAPYLTGALRNAIQALEKDGPLSWWVVVLVEYGLFQEVGTSRFAAHPYLFPSVEEERQKFLDDFKELFE